jgi:hypothetical protein
VSRRSDDVAFVGGLVLGVAVLVVFGFFSLRDGIVAHNDFTYVWAGARVVLDGANPYDSQTWPELTRAYRTARPFETVFGYPPWVALGLLPLALLPVPIASGLWTFGSMALAAIAVRALLRSVAPKMPVAHFLAALALFASQPGSANVWTGQWTFLLVAAMAVSVVAIREGRRLGLLAAIALLAKPHLVAFALVALARAVHARLGLGALVLLGSALGATVAIGWLAFPDWLEAWRTSLFAQRFAVRLPTTLDTSLTDLLGPAGHVLAAAAVFALAFAGLTFDPKGDAFLAVWLAISATTTVYGWSYDHLVLIVPLVIATGVLGRRSPAAATAFASLAFTFFLIAPTLLYLVADARANESFNAAVPLALCVLCLLALRSRRREAETAWSGPVERVTAPRLAL